MSERTEEATPRRREDARKKGQVPRSKELNTALLLIVAAGVIGPGADRMAAGIVRIFRYVVLAPTAIPTNAIGAAEWLEGLTLQLTGLVAVPALTMAGAAVFIGGVQGRGVLSWHPIQPKWSRISPLENGKRILGPTAINELLKSLLKLAIVGIALWVSLAGSVDEILALSQESPLALLELVHQYAPKLLLSAGIAYLALAGADYAFQIRQHEKSLKMSLQEVKQEQKENEGNPMVKTRLRSMGRALTRNRMIQSVAEADVVITNPTRLAIALKYDPEVAPAPMVVARGQRKIAKKIKKLALDAGVPVIEDKPLAWALFEGTKVGTVIPAELYQAVAEVLAFVFSQRQRARSNAYRMPSADA